MTEDTASQPPELTEVPPTPEGQESPPEPADSRPVLFTIPEACSYLRLGRSTLWRHLQAGLLTPTRLGGRTFIHRAELDRFISERT